MNPFLSPTLARVAGSGTILPRRTQQQGGAESIHHQRNEQGPAAPAANASQLTAAATRSKMTTVQRLIIQNVAAIQIGTPIVIDVPRQWTYDSIDLELRAGGTLLTTSQILAQVAWVEVILDSDTIWRLTPAEIFAFTDYYGNIPADNGIIPLQFARLTNPRILEQDSYSIGTANLTTFQVTVTLITGATVTSIVPVAQVRPNRNLINYVAFRRFIYPVPASGLQEFPNIQLDPRYSAEVLHFIGAGDGGLNVTYVQVYAFGGNFIDGTKNINDWWNIKYKRNPQSGWVHIDFNIRDRILDDFPLTPTDFKPKLTFGATPPSSTVHLIIQRLEKR